MISSIWNYRGFIWASVKRDFQLKYRNSLLGVIWTIINPVCMIFIYTVIFSQIMRARLPGVGNGFTYSVYLCSGIITWFFFSEIIQHGIDVFVNHANLIKKLKFPRICLPIIVVMSASLNFTIVFLLFTLYLCFSGYFPGLPFLAVPLVLMVQTLLAIGLSTYLGILNVFFRDVGQFFTLFLQIWFWCTPIVYSDSILPQWVRSVFQLNPMYSVVTAYHDIFVFHAWPNWGALVPSTCLGVVACWLGLRVFQRRNEDMVDEL